MKFVILSALVAAASAVPAIYAPAVAHTTVVAQPTIVTKTAKTFYAPITQSNYGSQVNHLVQAPAPIAVPVPQPYAVPRAIPVAVPRAVPVPMVAQAPALVTKSVVHAAPVVHGAAYGYAGHGAAYGLAGHGYGLNAGYGYGKGYGY